MTEAQLVAAGRVTVAEIERLRRMTWTVLAREALGAGVSIGAIRRAATRDELRLAILCARVEASPA